LLQALSGINYRPRQIRFLRCSSAAPAVAGSVRRVALGEADAETSRQIT